MADRWPFDWSPPAPAIDPGPDAGERAAVALASAVTEAVRVLTPGFIALGDGCRAALGALSALSRSTRPEGGDRD